MAKQPSPNPKYKLTYFNMTGLGEPIRMLFAYGGIKYEDNRIETEDWPALNQTSMGQVPVLEIDGIEVYQSLAVSRYLAKLVGLAGQNDWENLQIDIAVDNVNDFANKICAPMFEKDEGSKQRKLAELKKDIIPFNLDKLDALAKENNGYLALGRLTWADIFLLSQVYYLKSRHGFEIPDSHPHLKQVLTNASNVDSIEKWIENRPKTDA